MLPGLFRLTDAPPTASDVVPDLVLRIELSDPSADAATWGAVVQAALEEEGLTVELYCLLGEEPAVWNYRVAGLTARRADGVEEALAAAEERIDWSVVRTRFRRLYQESRSDDAGEIAAAYELFRDFAIGVGLSAEDAERDDAGAELFVLLGRMISVVQSNGAYGGNPDDLDESPEERGDRDDDGLFV